MSKKVEKSCLIATIIFFVIAMSGMIGYCMYRPAKEPETLMDAEKSTEAEMQRDAEEQFLGQELPYQTGMEQSDCLIIPVTAEVGEKQITITNDYMNKQITLTMQGMDGAYLYEKGLMGNLEGIQSVQCNQGEVDAVVKLLTDGVYEPELRYNAGRIYLKLVRPEEVYDKIIVIDPGHGADASGSVVDGIAEKDLVMSITNKLKTLLDETDIHVYYTRLDDTDPDLEERVGLANEVNADLFISLHFAADMEDSATYGIRTFYNGTFIIPEFSSADLAYLMEEQVCAATREKALGISPGEDDIYLIRNAAVPVALLELGYLTNKQEWLLIQREDYQAKIAQGIFAGIEEAFVQIEEANEERK